MLKAALFRVSRRLNGPREWVVGNTALLLLRLLRRLPPDAALDYAARAARRVGPWTGRHKVALDNLRQAFPEKSEAEIEAIALDMWGNMARLGAEYVFLDDLVNFDPDAPNAGRVEVIGTDRFHHIAGEAKPHILFSAHLGNFELLPVAGAAFGLRLTAMFRPPNNPYIASYILSRRRGAMGELLASRRGAAFSLSRILEEGGNVGLLVDQKFTFGIRSTFFGRLCETSPLLPKLARQHGCDVYPARCIRLPGNRFRLVIEDKVDLPRAPDGRVDITSTAQLLNDVVERWVREDPAQWMWFHKRWGLTSAKRRLSRSKRSLAAL